MPLFCSPVGNDLSWGKSALVVKAASMMLAKMRALYIMLCTLPAQ